MPTFPVSGPLTFRFEVGIGDVRLDVSDGPEATVEVRPVDPDTAADRDAAERTEVNGEPGVLTLRSQHRFRPFRAPWDKGAVHIEVTVPSGSAVEGKVGVGSLRTTGPLGACRVTVGVGDLVVDTTTRANLSTHAGDLELGRATGEADLSTASGQIRAGVLEGPAKLKSANGPMRVEQALGGLRANTANGDIAIGRATADVQAKSAHGDLAVLEALSGRVLLHTATGDLEVGVPDGTPVWMDLAAHLGQVRSDLAAGPAPDGGADHLEVEAHTHTGDIYIRRLPVADVA